MVKVPDLADGESWRGLRTAHGDLDSAVEVPEWTRKLLAAESEAECEVARNHLRNVIVRQGSVYRSAEYYIEYCLMLIGEGGATDLGMGDALDVVVEIVEGEPDGVEIENGNADVVDQCVDTVRRHESVLRELTHSDDEYVMFDALELLWVAFPHDKSLVTLAGELGERELRQRTEGVHRSFRTFLNQIATAEC